MSSDAKAPRPDPSDAVVIGEPQWLRVASWIVCPLLGAALAWLLTRADDWYLGLSWAPFRGPVRLFADIPEPAASLVAAAAGLVLGTAFAAVWERERVTVTVARDQVEVRRMGAHHVLSRDEVDSVFFGAKHLVLLGTGGTELVRESVDEKGEVFRHAFQAQGWPWTGDDPHADAYAMWVPGAVGVPPVAGPLLAARQEALDAKKSDDAKEIRSELLRLGVVVRDEKTRQYWRLVQR